MKGDDRAVPKIYFHIFPIIDTTINIHNLNFFDNESIYSAAGKYIIHWHVCTTSMPQPSLK